jgi:hypothetical protein
MEENMNAVSVDSGKSLNARSHTALSGYDGTIGMELSNRPVPYHISRCFPADLTNEQCQRMAMSACRVACMCVDVMRGRMPPKNLGRIMLPECMKRLETMAYLLKNHMRTHRELKERLCYLPAMPTLVNGVLVSSEITEMVVSVIIGREQYWVSLVFRCQRGRWVCTTADLG